MRFLLKETISAIVIFLITSSVFARGDDELYKTFEAKDNIRINTTSGDCVIRQVDGDKIVVRVTWDMRPRDVYEPEIRERANSLRLNENIHGSCSGNALWEIEVPNGTKIKFQSASGEFQAENLKGEFDISTASGDIELVNCSGEFELHSASGTVAVEECDGYFDMSSASGLVDASGVKFEHPSEFSSASGRVRVILNESPSEDLSVSTASGRAVLNFNGHPVKGAFEFTSRVRRGRVESPYEFENEEYYERHGQEYVAQTFVKGSDSPRIELGTASGKVSLLEK